MALSPLGPAMAGLSAGFNPQGSHATPSVKTLVRPPLKGSGISCLIEASTYSTCPEKKCLIYESETYICAH
jgi:hypothetical protein